jgi:hypothetical protein
MKNIYLTLFLLLSLTLTSHAQFSVFAKDLVSPVGVETDASGNHWVTDNGTGKMDGRILVVKPNGEVIPVITGLPSKINPVVGEPSGVWRSLFLPNGRLAVIIGEAYTEDFGKILIFDFRHFRLGRSAPKTVADAVSSIQVGAFSRTLTPESNIFSAVFDESGNWYVTDAAANHIVKISPSGRKSVFAKFPDIPNPTPIGPPMINAVPTKIIAKKGGGFYVATLTGFPFPEGAASIYSVDKRGNVSLFKSGLSLITDIALDQQTGDMYALQYAKFGFAPTPGYVLGSSKVWRIKAGNRNLELVAENFGPSPGMSFDRRGNLYVTSLFTSQLLKMPHVLRRYDDNCHFLEVEQPDFDIPMAQNKAKSSRLESYPNPVTDYLTVNWSEGQTPQSVRLIDLSGKIVFEKMNMSENATSQRIDLQGFSSGIYIVQLSTSAGVESRKFMVQK